MTHVRQQLRENVQTLLGDLGLSVQTNRVQEIDPSELPLAVVMTESESSTRADKGGTLERTISVTVVVVVPWDTDTMDDKLDEWAEKVEDRLRVVPPASVFTLVSTELDLRPDDDGQFWFGYLALEYEARVFG